MRRAAQPLVFQVAGWTSPLSHALRIADCGFERQACVTKTKAPLVTTNANGTWCGAKQGVGQTGDPATGRRHLYRTFGGVGDALHRPFQRFE